MTTKTIRRELKFSQPPAVVWRALAPPEALADWMYPNDFSQSPRDESPPGR